MPSRIRKFAGNSPGRAAGRARHPTPGVDGFRRSHQQAHGARGVAIAAGTDVTAAGDPGLAAVALLAQNLAEAQVWVCETLGPLASDTDKTLACGTHSAVPAARLQLQGGGRGPAAALQLGEVPGATRGRTTRQAHRRRPPRRRDRPAHVPLVRQRRPGASLRRVVSPRAERDDYAHPGDRSSPLSPARRARRPDEIARVVHCSPPTRPSASPDRPEASTCDLDM